MSLSLEKVSVNITHDKDFVVYKETSTEIVS